MPRPRRTRLVSDTPAVTYFKPRGVPLRELGEVAVPIEGLEALRLADLEGLSAQEAAVSMGVSRHTFGRILAEARRATADALVNGKAIRVEGGSFALVERPATLFNPKEPDMNKIAISAEGPSLKDRVDPRFGRAPGFVVVDVETLATEYLDNGASQARGQGAGVVSAGRIREAGAGVVLTGVIGSKAFDALRAAGVSVGLNLEGLTVGEAVERYKAGGIPMAAAANR